MRENVGITLAITGGFVSMGYAAYMVDTYNLPFAVNLFIIAGGILIGTAWVAFIGWLSGALFDE